MLSNVPKFYNHAELNQPAKPVAQKPVEDVPSNPYLYALYLCGESTI